VTFVTSTAREPFAAESERVLFWAPNCFARQNKNNKEKIKEKKEGILLIREQLRKPRKLSKL
jgi:hypothetical protein